MNVLRAIQRVLNPQPQVQLLQPVLDLMLEALNGEPLWYAGRESIGATECIKLSNHEIYVEFTRPGGGCPNVYVLMLIKRGRSLKFDESGTVVVHLWMNTTDWINICTDAELELVGQLSTRIRERVAELTSSRRATKEA